MIDVYSCMPSVCGALSIAPPPSSVRVAMNLLVGLLVAFWLSSVQLRRPGPSRGWGSEVSYLGPRAPPTARNIKYARMYHFEKKIQKFLLRGAPRECFRGSRCGSRRAWKRHITTDVKEAYLIMQHFWWLSANCWKIFVQNAKLSQFGETMSKH